MIRVAAFTSSRDDPSSRFRMRQFFDPLRAFGIETREFRPWIGKYASARMQITGLGLLSRVLALAAARKLDIAWLNREFVTGLRTFERFAGRRRLLDVDDAIWLHGRPGFARRIARESSGVIAGNNRIARYFEGFAPRIWVVPTGIDTERWTPAPTPAQGFTVGWSGTGWNLSYLEQIEIPLARFLEAHRDAKLLIVSDRRPALPSLAAERVEFQQWSAETEVAHTRRMDVGIMPLPDNEWTSAKCAMKMLCYLSVGRPVVVSPVGTAKDILEWGAVGLAARSPDEWFDALAKIYRDKEQSDAMGRCGRRVAQEHYSVEKLVPALAQIFEETMAL